VVEVLFVCEGGNPCLEVACDVIRLDGRQQHFYITGVTSTPPGILSRQGTFVILLSR
jgi:hypothetical protein